MELAVILNPIAGGGLALRMLPDIKIAFQSLGFKPKYFQTEHKGHAKELALSFAKAGLWDVVVAVGGDGTINEVASGLVGTQTPLGIIPLGSGNGLGRQLGIHGTLLNAVQVIAGNNWQAIDSATVNGRSFFVTAGVGLDGVISQRFSLSKNRGFSGYALAAIRSLSTWRPFSATVVAATPEGETTITGSFTIIALANAEQYGNGAYIAHGASLNDGLLNLTSIGSANIWYWSGIGRMLFNKNLAKHRLVSTLLVSKVDIFLDKAQYYHLDGEPCGLETTFHIAVSPLSLKVLVP